MDDTLTAQREVLELHLQIEQREAYMSERQ
jgi:hypothetical protein